MLTKDEVVSQLSEKRVSTARSFDARPCAGSRQENLNVTLFRNNYLEAAIDPEILAANHRTTVEQLGSMRMYDLSFNTPTNAGILVSGNQPLHYFPGAYMQYVKFSGTALTSGVQYEKRFAGPLILELKNIEEFIKSSIVKERPVKNGSFQEKILSNYPFWSLRELVMNAIMHWDYESNAPVYIYEFENRIEIQNPGGLFGDVRLENFPNTSDYRNPVLAEVLKTLGYVNRFNFGIRNAQFELEKNGNGLAVFNLELKTKFQVLVPAHLGW